MGMENGKRVEFIVPDNISGNIEIIAEAQKDDGSSYALDRVRGRLFTMNLQAVDYRDNIVGEKGEESPGVLLHWNIDDDDNSGTNEMHEVKRPGADYLQMNEKLLDEDDLKHLSVLFDDIPTSGIISLSMGKNGRIWRYPQKYAISNIVVNVGQRRQWNLANPLERMAFTNAISSLYVEGINKGSSEVVLEYQSPDNGTIYDKICYHFFAADCGRQPNPDERNEIKEIFENLVDCEWSITGEPDIRYNCLAWAAGIGDKFVVERGRTNAWVNINGTNVCYSSVDYYGNGNNILEKFDLDTLPSHKDKKGVSQLKINCDFTYFSDQKLP